MLYIQKYGENIFVYIFIGFQSKLLGTSITHLHKSSKAHCNSKHVNHRAAHIVKKKGPFLFHINNIINNTVSKVNTIKSQIE